MSNDIRKALRFEGKKDEDYAFDICFSAIEEVLTHLDSMLEDDIRESTEYQESREELRRIGASVFLTNVINRLFTGMHLDAKGNVSLRRLTLDEKRERKNREFTVKRLVRLLETLHENIESHASLYESDYAQIEILEARIEQSVDDANTPLPVLQSLLDDMEQWILFSGESGRLIRGDVCAIADYQKVQARLREREGLRKTKPVIDSTRRITAEEREASELAIESLAAQEEDLMEQLEAVVNQRNTLLRRLSDV